MRVVIRNLSHPVSVREPVVTNHQDTLHGALVVGKFPGFNWSTMFACLRTLARLNYFAKRNACTAFWLAIYGENVVEPSGICRTRWNCTGPARDPLKYLPAFLL